MADDIYPDAPGWKAQETSRLAADRIADKAPIWRARCLRAIAAAPLGLTADEVADILQHDICSIRPRVSELLRLGKVEKTGERRRTRSGCTAIVWRAVEAGNG